MIARIVLGTLVAGCLAGCGNDTTAPKQNSFPTSAEQVLEQLQSAYRSRDINAYSTLLAPEFTFVFQPIDVQELGDTWTKDQDVAGTTALFSTELISNILIELLHHAPEQAGDGFPAGTVKLQITNTNLEVDQADGITWLVLDRQEMYFRAGLDGEDPDRWFMIEWRDIPTVNSPSSAAVKATTWGKIKAQYLYP